MRTIPFRMFGGQHPPVGGPIGGTSSHAAWDDGFVADDKVSHASKEFTLESWIMVDQPAPATLDINPTIEIAQQGLEQSVSVGHASWSDGVTIDLSIGVNAYWPDWSAQGGASVSLEAFTPTNTWVHLAVTGTRNGPSDHTIRVYRNGIEVAEFAFAYDHLPFDGGRLFLRSDGGQKPTPNETERWGRVHFDEVRVWTHVRTEAEILAGMSQRMAANTTGLVLYYGLDNTLANDVAGRPALTADGVTYITDTPF